MIIRLEIAADMPSIRQLTDAAFRDVVYSSQTEGAIIDALRLAGVLALSLVAEQNGMVVGHAAFSPVLIDGDDIGWFGLGPVSVSLPMQRRGVGSALINEGLQLLRDRGACGAVVLGDPDYYRRFGFTSDHQLSFADVSPAYFQSIVLAGTPAKGVVTYHEAFAVR